MRIYKEKSNRFQFDSPINLHTFTHRITRKTGCKCDVRLERCHLVWRAPQTFDETTMVHAAAILRIG